MAVGTTIIGATVSSTFSFILNLLLPSLREELGLLAGFEDDLEKLKDLFTRISSVLDDAMTRQLKDKAIQDWLEKLTDVAYNAEDVLDEFNFEALRRKTAYHEGHLRKVRDFFSSNNQLKFRILMAHKIKDLNWKINSFAEEGSKFNLGQVASQGPSRDTEENETHSYFPVTDFIGRDEEKERVLAMLLDAGATAGNISAVAIVGVGGIGKTTLAQVVYNDSRVDEYFDLKLWICVSDNFVLLDLLKSIIKLAKETCNVDGLGLEQLQKNVRDVLRRKRFLLVLDNVWNEELQEWKNLDILLRSGLRDSKVVVTTRSQKFPLIMRSKNLLLGPLPGDCSWNLFKRQAFNVGETPSKNLEKIGKEIAKKCGGNPLALMALGSYLRVNEEEEWKVVEESEMWQLFNSEKGKIKPILQLSYDHLNPQEKQCFAFSSLFPKDYEMEKKTLIKMWTSNGFVQKECDGHKVFNNLLGRSFFLEAKKDENGNVIKCKLHDLMHDLARSVAGKHFCMATKDIGKDAFNKRTYHLLINQWSSTSAMLEETKKAKSVRTLLICRCNPIEKSLLGKIFVTLRCMRVLDLSSSGITIVPDSVCCLMHLRYLDMSSNPIELLPKSIGYLLNLQVLKLTQTTKLKNLPKSLKKLQSLRHLDIRGCSFLTNMPVGLERLTHLRTLSDFVVGKSKTSSTLKELKELDLSGELFIWHLENFKTEATENEQTILFNKKDLVSLRLTWDHHNNLASNNDNERALDLLRPHKNLEQLQLHNYTGPKFPLWLSDSLLESLVEVKLVYCTNCEHLPALGSILSLKDLQIIGMHEVKKIGVEFYGTGPVKGFPSLEKLAFFDMPKLEEWSVLEGMSFSQLIALTMGKCGVLRSIPLVQSLQTLDLSHCSSLLLNSLPKSSNLLAFSSLVIDNIQGLASFPDDLLLCLSSMRRLIVSSCKELKSLPLDDMEKLVAIRFLEIFDCPQLDSLSFNATRLTCLQSLNIRNCTSLKSLPKNWTSIISLQSMNISNCPNVTSWTELEIMGLRSLTDFSLDICNDKVDLSGWLQHITNLETLTIHGGHENLLPQPGKLIMGNYLMICCCGNRLGSLLHGLSNASLLEDLSLKRISGTVLPDSIGEIRSLQHLLIRDCEGFESLPNSLRGLTRLEGLWIQDCLNLERRCQRDTGEDWSIIQHVRSVRVVKGNIPNNELEGHQETAEKMAMVLPDPSRDQKHEAVQETKIQTRPKEASQLESEQQVGSELSDHSIDRIPSNAIVQEQLAWARKEPEQCSSSSHSKALEKCSHSVPTNRRPGKEPMLEQPKKKETIKPEPKLMGAAIRAARPISIQNNGNSYSGEVTVVNVAGTLDHNGEIDPIIDSNHNTEKPPAEPDSTPTTPK